jgi:hypothetical protein
MSGTLVMGELLRSYGPLTATMPAALILEEELPQGASRGIVVESISVIDRNTLSDGVTRRVRERTQVTIMEPNVRQRRATWKLVRAAGASRRGDFAGVTEVSALLDGAGPDLRMDNPTMYLKTQDFTVSYNEPA